MNLCSFILGIPKVAQCNFRLPLRLICIPAQPSKAANHKLTIDTNKPPISFLTIFPGRFLDMSVTGNVLETSTEIVCLCMVMSQLAKLMSTFKKCVLKEMIAEFQ